jgi:hypothetical protein
MILKLFLKILTKKGLPCRDKINFVVMRTLAGYGNNVNDADLRANERV